MPAYAGMTTQFENLRALQMSDSIYFSSFENPNRQKIYKIFRDSTKSYFYLRQILTNMRFKNKVEELTPYKNCFGSILNPEKIQNFQKISSRQAGIHFEASYF